MTFSIVYFILLRWYIYLRGEGILHNWGMVHTYFMALVTQHCTLRLISKSPRDMKYSQSPQRYIMCHCQTKRVGC